MPPYRALPIKTAYTGVACMNCMRSEPADGVDNNNNQLLRCVRCKRAHYCSKACQKADWGKHKPECTLFQKLAADFHAVLPGNSPAEKAATLGLLGDKGMIGTLLPSFSEKNLSRHKQFLQYTRTCTICKKTEFETNNNTADIEWQCCPRCKFGWCCSRQHWQEYESQHSEEICKAYRDATALEKFCWNHFHNYDEQFMFVPDSSRMTLLKKFPKNWDAYFEIRAEAPFRAARSGRLPDEFLPAATHLLSQPIMCLQAIYLFGIDHFKDLSTLTVHVAGPSTGYELYPTCVWEEIMHCLPAVKEMNIVFVGPEATQGMTPPRTVSVMNDMEACPSCQSSGRKRNQSFIGKTYHDFRASPELFTPKPDLIVAFNTGLHEVETESWKTSVEVMMDLNVPCLFTSYCKDEVDKDIQFLRSWKANLVTPEPVLNPFKSELVMIECCGRDAFYHGNMYYTAFQGRR